MRIIFSEFQREEFSGYGSRQIIPFFQLLFHRELLALSSGSIVDFFQAKKEELAAGFHLALKSRPQCASRECRFSFPVRPHTFRFE